LLSSKGSAKKGLTLHHRSDDGWTVKPAWSFKKLSQTSLTS